MNNPGCNVHEQIVSGETKMYVSCLEAVLYGASQVRGIQLFPAKTEMCVWILASSVIHLNVASIGNFLWANVAEHWLFSCTQKGPRTLGSVLFPNPGGGWGPAQCNGTSSEQECQRFTLHLSLLHSWLHSQEFLSEAHLARKMKNREQEVGEAFYGMAFSLLFLKGFFLQFMSVWVRSVC